VLDVKGCSKAIVFQEASGENATSGNALRVLGPTQVLNLL